MNLSVVHVVVPAHDEEARIGVCLRSLGVAIHQVRAAHPGLTVRLTLVLDRCRDGTADAARRAGTEVGADVDVVAIDAQCVGAARAAGVAQAARQARGIAPEHVWIANTDADCDVPATWLLEHVRLAEDVDLIVGGVRLEPTDSDTALVEEWRRRHRRTDAHVHGANLGVRLATYLRAGGFPSIREHEDVALVGALDRIGARRAHGTWVTTSARRRGRTPGGFAGYLRRLEAELAGWRSTPSAGTQLTGYPRDRTG